MLPLRNTLKLFHRWPLAIIVACLSTGAGAAANPNLADAPIGSTIIVPANVLLDLSVEFPTAVSDAYYSVTTYTPATEFTGYFNPNFCYDYAKNTAYSGSNVQFGRLLGYFAPVGAATTRTCSGHWSGNFLNWVMTQTIDPLRKTLTGGARIVDLASTTILQKAYQDNQGGGSNQNVKSITTAADVAGATPFSNWTRIYVNNRNTGLDFVFSQSRLGAGTTTGTSFADVTVASLNSSTSCSRGGSGTGGSTIPPSDGFVLFDSPSTLTVTQGCSNTSAITVTYESEFSGTVTFAVSGLPSGVTASSLPSITRTATTTLTLTASNTATPGASTITITGTSGAKTSSVTINLTVEANPSIGNYSAQSAMQVCSGVDAPSDLETSGGRCRAYGGNYKPVGLMQKYAAENTTQTDAIRYSAFGYLLDSDGGGGNARLDGGVMRAGMKSVGPYQANPGTSVSANPTAEWDATTGVFNTNPNPVDAATTPADSSDPTGVVSNSGVVNYLNKFGFASSANATVSSAYKRYDSVSELFYAATRYYRNLGNLSSHTSTGPAATEIAAGRATNDNFPVVTTWNDPIKYSCSTNYIVGIGDEHTWNDGNVPGSTLNGGNEVADAQVTADTGVNATTATNYIGNLENLAQYTGAGVVPGATANNGNDIIQPANIGSIFANTFTGCCNGNTFYMAGLAYDAHTRDIRPDILVKNAPVTVATFWLDVMEGNTYYEKNPFWMTAKYGGFDTSNTTAFPGGYSEYGQVAPLPIVTWNTGAYRDDRNNDAPDQYYQARDPAAMAAGLNKAFAKIAASVPSGTAAALSLASSSVTTSNNANYAVSFASDWSGDVIGEQLATTTTGGVISTTATVKWHARDWLPNKAAPVTGVTELTAATRVIATSSSIAAASGVAFEIANISVAEQATLGATAAQRTKVLNYVRGDQTNEGAAPAFRPRNYTLGDITNSKPAVVGAPSFPYSDTPLNPGYSAFVSANSGRSSMIYVGANDGMMHAFDASLTDATGGKELFAYVPSFLFNTNVDSTGNPVGLASVVVNPLQHHFLVDAQPTVIDVDFARTRASGAAPASTVPSDWHSVLIGGVGKGGKGYFALDVTNPAAITTESAMAGKVLWEASYPHMGYSYGRPLVIKTVKYGWTVVLTSGYDNDNGKGYIYLVSPTDGTLYETISTGAGALASPAGLAFVSGYINNYADYAADSLYAGDLLGNVWRVDLTSPTSTATVQLFATLADSFGNAQPVTTQPTIGTDPSTQTRYVFVGTGRLLADTDLVSSKQQTFYAFTDGNNAAFAPITTPLTRSNLANDSAVAALAATALGGVAITPLQRGFYIDLLQFLTPPPGQQAAAERINVQPVASGGVVAFAANLYGQDPCSTGSGRVFALSYDSGPGGTGSIGNSLLTNSLGVGVGSASNPNNAITGETIGTGPNGNLVVGVGLGPGGGTQFYGVNAVASSLKKLNWREVPSVN